MEILTWAQRKTIIQTQFVSVVSKLISDIPSEITYGSRINNRYIKFGIIHNGISVERLNIIRAVDCHFPTPCFAI